MDISSYFRAVLTGGAGSHRRKIEVKMFYSKNCGHGFDMYTKALVYTRSLLKPLTVEDAIMDELRDKTGIIYVPYIPSYCPVCGKKVEWMKKEGGADNEM